MNRDEETHDELMRVFREYYKANQRWLDKGTRQAGLETRQLLSELRIIARQRRANIQEWRHWVDEDKAERKANQDQQGSEEDDTN